MFDINTNKLRTLQRSHAANGIDAVDSIFKLLHHCSIPHLSSPNCTFDPNLVVMLEIVQSRVVNSAK